MVTKDERVERLRSIPLFMACNDKQLQFIATRVEDLEFKAGRVLCEQGKSGGEFFIVLSGEADVQRDGRSVDTVKPGDHFGEIALIDDGPRTATVVAKTPLRCLVLSPRQFQDVLHQDAEIAVHILRDVTKRLRKAVSTLPAD
ncbi:MAG: cyclic nucleotide-binding domain-containing protein [Candidatus Limnocylindria bacterium]